MLKKICNISLVFLLFNVVSHAAETAPKVLSFQQWKESQSLQAKNRLARETNKLTIAKGQNRSKEELQSFAKDVSVAENAVEITQDYTIEDYFLVYLLGPEMENEGQRQDVLRAAANMMSPEEVTELMKIWMNSLHPQDSKAKSSKTGWIPSKNSQI